VCSVDLATGRLTLVDTVTENIGDNPSYVVHNPATGTAGRGRLFSALIGWHPYGFSIQRRVGCGVMQAPPSSARHRLLHERAGRGGARARSHCRVVQPLIHFIPDLQRESVPLFLKRQCARTLGGGGQGV
jgi:hypothetical protein